MSDIKSHFAIPADCRRARSNPTTRRPFADAYLNTKVGKSSPDNADLGDTENRLTLMNFPEISIANPINVVVYYFPVRGVSEYSGELSSPRSVRSPSPFHLTV